MTETKEIPMELVHSGINFLREITAHYGDEQGMALWRSMSNGMGKEIQDAILLSMLRGNVSRQVIVAAQVSMDQQRFIDAIKWVRSVTGYGLKDAKDFMDNVRYHGPRVLKLQPDANVRDFVYAMSAAGYKVE